VLTELEVTNFQGFAGEQSVQLAPITLIFGPNASGKSSIGRAFDTLSEQVANPDKNLSFSNFSKFPAVVEYTKSGGTGFKVGVAKSFEMQRTFSAYPAKDFLGRWKLDRFNNFFVARVGQGNKFTGQGFCPIDDDMTSPWKFLNGQTKSVSESQYWKLIGEDPDNLFEKFQPIPWVMKGVVPQIDMDLFDWHLTELELGSGSRQINGHKDLVLAWVTVVSSMGHSMEDFSLSVVKADRRRPEPYGPQFRDSATDAFFSLPHSVPRLERVNRWLEKLTNGRYSYKFESQTDLDSLTQTVSQRMQQSIFDSYTGANVTFENVGAGLGVMYDVLQELANPSSNYIYVEQPEIHLHPLMQGHLAEVIVDAALSGDQKKQIFLETHSENLLLAFQKLIRNQTVKPSDVSVVYVEGYEGEPVGLEGIHRYNKMTNIRLDQSGDLLDPFPESFSSMRANYLFG